MSAPLLRYIDAVAMRYHEQREIKKMNELKISYIRSDMKYDDYHWNLSADIAEIPDHAKFNPNDGNEVLNVINAAAEKLRIRDKKLCEYFEILIRKRFPSSVHSHEDAIIWLQKVYKSL